ncbi:MAG: hypothetical protein ACM31H_00590 [Nitrososphaerales archaeon]
MFNPKNIDNLTKQNIETFLRSKNNRHWRDLGRQRPEITENMKKLKSTLRILLNESIPIEERIQRIRDPNSPEYHKRLAHRAWSACG